MSVETKSSDEDEFSSSAPIELLSEFLSALMLRDYKVALVHCKTILNYEPENKTAVEFYPLIQQRLTETETEEDSSSEDEEMKSTCSSDDSSWSSSSSSGEYSTMGNSFLSCSGTMTELESDAKFESMDEKDDLSP